MAGHEFLKGHRPAGQVLRVVVKMQPDLGIELARILEYELTAKLDGPVGLAFDAYPLDLAGRAQSFQKLVAGGVSVNDALATAGLLLED